MNRLGDMGMDFLCDALCENTALEYLDLFDVNFTNKGGSYIEYSLRLNKTLRWLRLSNTTVSSEVSQVLLDTVLESKSLLTFRWINLMPIRDKEWDCCQIDKLMLVEF